MMKKNPFLDVIIIISTLIGIFIFLIVVLGSIDYFSKDLSPIIKNKQLNEKLWVSGILIAIIYSSMGFIEAFINGLVSSIKNLNTWSIQKKLKRKIRNV